MRKVSSKIIITAALTGSQTYREHNPNVPYTAKEVAEEARRCREEGASIIHVHARDPETGKPTSDLNHIKDIVRAVRSECDILINLSTAISEWATENERIAVISECKPDFCSLNTGSMNFAFEVNYKTGKIGRDWVFLNPFTLMSRLAAAMMENGVKPELEVYDLGHIHNTFLLKLQNILLEPLHYQFVFGVAGGVRFNLPTFSHFLQEIPDGSTWSVCGVGPNSFPVCMVAAAAGGHMRVGLEDNIYLSGKTLAKGSWEQVKKAAEIARHVERAIATPEETKEILHLPKR